MGAPHLHFEIRTPNNEAISPLTFYPNLKDGRAPRFEEITLVPMSPNSLIDGQSIPKSYKFKYSKENNNYFISEIPKLTGAVGLEVKVADRRSGVKRKYNVSELQLYIDDSLVFQTKYDTLSFDTWGLVDTDYNHYQRIDGKSYYHNLYSSQKSNSPFHSKTKNPLRDLFFSDNMLAIYGIFNLKIIVKDSNGKVREGLFQFEKLPVLGHLVDPNNAPDLRGRDSQTQNENTSEPVSPISEMKHITHACRSNSAVRMTINVYNPNIKSFETIDSIPFKQHQNSNCKSKLYSLENKYIWDLVRKSQTGYNITRIDYYNSEGLFSSQLIGVNEKPSIRYFEDGFDTEIDFIDSIIFIRSRPRVSINVEKLYQFFIKNNFYPNFQQSIDLNNDVNFNLSQHKPLRDIGYGVEFKPLIDALCMNKILSEDYYIPNSRRSIVIANDRIYLSFDRNFNDNYLFQMLPIENGVEINPDDRLLDPPAELFLSIPEGYPDDKSAMYGISRSGEPGFIASEIDSLGRIGGTIRSFGTYKILADSSGPSIYNIYPRNGTVVTKAKSQIKFHMDDDLSGFDSDTLLIVTLDDEYLVSEYDVDNEMVYSYLNKKLSPGKHQLKIIARDRLGNITVRNSTFKYQP